MNDYPIRVVSTEDEEMNRAIQNARSTLGQFLEAFVAPLDNQNSFLLKVRFTEGDQAEHIWMADLDLNTDPSWGTVANEPHLKGFSFMERRSFSPEWITDWMYMEEGELIGGFTTRLLQWRQSREV